MNELILRENPMTATAAPQRYVHTRTFFQFDRWAAHDLIGELLARGVTQVAIALEGSDYTVAWTERTPPDVVRNAEDTPA